MVIPIFIAFFAGFVSFISPCVLPLIPSYLAYLVGESLSSAAGENLRRKRTAIFLASLFFVLGFSLVFALLGILLNNILVKSAVGAQSLLSEIGGTIIIFFGLYLMGFFKINFLEAKHELSPKFKIGSRYLTSFLFGFAFAVGWTPCVGPVLGGILGLAAAEPSSAFILLLSYALGLGIPFLLVGLFVSQASHFIERSAKVLRFITPIFGGILVVIGILVFTQDLSLVANLGF